jgi:SAM-dependent methyltransferase
MAAALRTADTIREPSLSDPTIASYEEVPFDSGPVTNSHPDALATVATLYGMTPPPLDGCRVLELGCSTGGNLLSMALSLPDSTFVGIDLAPRQITQARALAATLGLTNVDLRAMSIADVDDDLGMFDYIVCHGVYSWVPEPIREAILRVCSRNLAPNGVAFVSYNTFPGWHARAMVREMIVFHDDPTRPPMERVARRQMGCAVWPRQDCPRPRHCSHQKSRRPCGNGRPIRCNTSSTSTSCATGRSVRPCSATRRLARAARRRRTRSPCSTSPRAPLRSRLRPPTLPRSFAHRTGAS